MRRTLASFLGGCALLLLQVALAAEDKKDETNPIGRPDQFVQGKKAMCAVYFEDGQWQLRMTSRDGKKAPPEQFSGTVRIEGDRVYGNFQGLEKAKKAKNADWIVVHQDGRGFDFQFHVHGQADGISFKAGKAAKNISFKILTSGDDDPMKILIGSKGVNPEKASFVLPAHPDK